MKHMGEKIVRTSKNNFPGEDFQIKVKVSMSPDFRVVCL